MTTLNQRVTALEQQTPCKVFTTHQLATCTDEELLDIFLASPNNGSHEAWVLANEGASHGE